MNPWDIVAWIGATAVSTLIVAFTITIFGSLIRGPRGRKRIL